jgi:hypothetical protein
MSATLLDASDGILTIEIKGKISPATLASVQGQILETLQTWGGGAMLLLCDEFEGWTNGDWSDTSFQMQADNLLRKMAIIGELQWKDMAMAFTGQGYRPFPIAFFESGLTESAKAWLSAE